MGGGMGWVGEEVSRASFELPLLHLLLMPFGTGYNNDNIFIKHQIAEGYRATWIQHVLSLTFLFESLLN